MVEWKELKEVFDTRNGYTPSTSNEAFWEGGYIPWFKMEDIRDNGNILYDSYLHITDKAIKGKGLFKANSILLATSATIGEHALIEVEHLSNQRFTNFYPKKEYEQFINMRYAYYYMFIIDEWCKQHVNQGGFASVDTGGLYKLSFPIPSLEEQTRIVGILDTFTSAIDNLKEQIAQRRKQYEYYRDQLLDLEGKPGVEMKTLGEIGDVCMCKRIMKDQTTEQGDVPFYKIGTFGGVADAYISRELYEDYKSKFSYPKKGEILLSASGTIGRKVVYNGEDAYFQDSNIVWIANNEKLVTNAYLYYLYSIVDWKVDGGTIKRLYNYNLKSTIIPVPSLSEQQRIVDILDKFEASIQNLEAQLKEREKQYEYYRNKLLSFE